MSGPTTWLFEFFHELREPQRHDPGAIGRHFDFYVDLWASLERRGWDGIFFSEHHFGAGYAPSPNLLISHLAAMTTDLRLGVLGVVGPYTTPWRAAEEFGMLDHLTHGRLEMGIVSGIPPEFIAAGLSIPEMGERHAEICDVLDQARLSTEPITHHGTHWSFDMLRLVPPFRAPGKPLWTAVRGEESARRAARRGWKICSGFNSAANLRSVYDAYRDESAANGRAATPDDLGLRRMVTLTERPDQTREGIRRAKQSLLDLLNASAGPLPPFAAILDRPDDENDHLSNDEFVTGTPEQVAEQLLEQLAVVGAGHLSLMFSDVEPDRLLAAHEAFSDGVLPLLRAGEVTPG